MPDESPNPKNRDEWQAWDQFAAAALTWKKHIPVNAVASAADAAKVADQLLLQRRARKT